MHGQNHIKSEICRYVLLYRYCQRNPTALHILLFTNISCYFASYHDAVCAAVWSTYGLQNTKARTQATAVLPTRVSNCARSCYVLLVSQTRTACMWQPELLIQENAQNSKVQQATLQSALSKQYRVIKQYSAIRQYFLIRQYRLIRQYCYQTILPEQTILLSDTTALSDNSVIRQYCLIRQFCYQTILPYQTILLSDNTA